MVAMYRQLPSGDNTFQDAGRTRELPDIRSHHLFRKRLVQIANGAGHLRMTAGDELSGVARYEQGKSVVLMIIGLGVLVEVHEAAMIEQRAVAFADCAQLVDQV